MTDTLTNLMEPAAPRTASAGSVVPAHAPFRSPITRLYSWRALLPRLGFLLPELVIALPLGILSLTLTAVGVPLMILWVGFPLTIAGLALARGQGAFTLSRLRHARMPRIEPPTWRPLEGSWLRRTMRTCLRADYWRAVAFSVANLVLAPVTWSFTIAFTALVLALPSLLVQLGLRALGVPSGDGENQTVGELLFSIMSPEQRDRWLIGPHGLDLLMFGAGTLVGLLLLPFVAGLAIHAHHALASGLLGRTRADRLAARVDDLSAARRSATEAEERSLRRLERDLHDGPQQQLLRLQLDLEAAQRRLADESSDPAQAAQLLAEARDRAAETLSDLRRLSKGIAPPLLVDRGLEAAVRALAERNPVPTRVEVEAGATADLSPAVGQGVYFVVSELYANTLKHAGASSLSTRIARERTDEGAEILAVEVADDGVGGARVVPGGGLDGLAERLRGLDGTLEVSSPAGGPTRVRAVVPL